MIAPALLAFIADTVGAEAKRVAELYDGAAEPAARFIEAIPELCDDGRAPREIWLRWWDGDKLCFAQRYELSHPSGKVIAGPGGRSGEYVPDGAIPKVAGLEFDIAVYFWDDGMEQLMVHGDGRLNRRALEHTARARVFTKEGV